MLDEAETTPRRVGDAFKGESLIRLLKQVLPSGYVSLAAVETGRHDQIRVA